jgi:hypothetical protein
MLIDNQNRLELESKVLAAAFKQGVDHGDLAGADLAHKALFRLIRERHLPTGLNTRSTSWPTNRSTEQYDIALQAAILARDSQPVSLPVSETPAENFSPGNGHDLLTVAEDLPAPPFVRDDSESDDLVATGPAPVNVYELLAIPHTSSVEVIHKKFLKQVRKVLVSKTKTKGVYPRKSLEMLRNLWIAHDILTDESIRADYDANVLGLVSVANPDRSKRKDPPTLVDAEDAAALRLGELLRAAGLIDQTELEIACDMHKAVREMPFGRFLIKQDFIEEDQLEAVLLGQRFLRDGLIDLDQFQEAMETFTRSSKDLEQILLENGFIAPSDLSKIQDLIQQDEHPTFSRAAPESAPATTDKSKEISTMENCPAANLGKYDRASSEDNDEPQDQGEAQSKQRLAESKTSERRNFEVALSELDDPS